MATRKKKKEEVSCEMKKMKGGRGEKRRGELYSRVALLRRYPKVIPKQ